MDRSSVRLVDRLVTKAPALTPIRAVRRPAAWPARRCRRCPAGRSRSGSPAGSPCRRRRPRPRRPGGPARGAAARAGRRIRTRPRTRVRRRACSPAGADTSRPGGWYAANWPGRSGWSPISWPSATTSPTAPGCGFSGSSSRTRNTVLTGSRPGTAAICTARIENLAHSTVSLRPPAEQQEAVQRPVGLQRGHLDRCRSTVHDDLPVRVLAGLRRVAGRVGPWCGRPALADKRAGVPTHVRSAPLRRQFDGRR